MLSERQVQAWVTRYNDGGTDALADRPGRGCKPPLTGDQEQQLKGRLRAEPTGADGGVCTLRDVLFWAPTREASLLAQIDPDDVPENFKIVLSGNLINGKPPKGWPYTSTVVTDYDEATCPSSKEGGSCTDNDCAACWDRDVKTVKYLKH